eukprot:TRINITY_DN13250_c1_g2_i2.p1 TRINITY_DN13250_c1_g2~~TRINITY_DN13250_c1_g2_i2.p1  ORF type:complete len:117 (-),score=10.95 TRINITY_DN13250_c1_g2_i2:365-715(-)
MENELRVDGKRSPSHHPSKSNPSKAKVPSTSSPYILPPLTSSIILCWNPFSHEFLGINHTNKGAFSSNKKSMLNGRSMNFFPNFVRYENFPLTTKHRTQEREGEHELATPSLTPTI